MMLSYNDWLLNEGKITKGSNGVRGVLGNGLSGDKGTGEDPVDLFSCFYSSSKHFNMDAHRRRMKVDKNAQTIEFDGKMDLSCLPSDCKWNNLARLLNGYTIISCSGIYAAYSHSPNKQASNLSSLDGFPITVNGDCDISELRLKSLNGIPKTVTGNLILINNKGKTFTEDEIRKVCDVGGNVILTDDDFLAQYKMSRYHHWSYGNTKN